MDGAGNGSAVGGERLRRQRRCALGGAAGEGGEIRATLPFCALAVWLAGWHGKSGWGGNDLIAGDGRAVREHLSEM